MQLKRTLTRTTQKQNTNKGIISRKENKQQIVYSKTRKHTQRKQKTQNDIRINTHIYIYIYIYTIKNTLHNEYYNSNNNITNARRHK